MTQHHPPEELRKLYDDTIQQQLDQGAGLDDIDDIALAVVLDRHAEMLRASIIKDIKHYFASVDDSLYDDVLTLCGRIERGEYGRVSDR